MKRIALFIPAVLLLEAVACQTASAQTIFFPANATINYSITDNVVVGFANGTDLSSGQNPISPTINLVSGCNLSGNLSAYNASIINVSGGSINTLTALNNSTVNVTGGTVSNLFAYNSSTVNLTGGNITTALNGYNSSVINVKPGSTSKDINIYNNSTVNVTGGTIANLKSSNNGILNVSSGTITGNLNARDNGRITMTAGTVNGTLGVSQTSRATISGGNIGFVNTFTGTRTTISGGNINALTTNSQSTVTMTGGRINGDVNVTSYAGISTLNLSGGSVGGFVNVYNVSKFNLNGNAGIARDVFTRDESTATLTGGSITGNLTEYNSSTVNLKGGRIDGNLYALNTSTLSIFGTNLVATLVNSNVSLGNGIFASQFRVSGLLEDGTALTNKNVYIQNGSGVTFTLSNSATLIGTLEFQGIVSSAAAQNITFTLRPADGSANITRTVSVPSSGIFSLSGLPQKVFTVHIAGLRYLAKNVVVDTTVGNVSGITVPLLAGDANNDNFADIADLLLLIEHYNKVAPAADYLGTCDFNGDGNNDIADLLLLVSNYNKQGDS